MKDKDLLKLLLSDGWEIVRIRGSHHVLQKDKKLK
ncbi:MAG: type II toxin-antitoxin system HicA family toxin [Oscillospiraceae bacterium]